MRINELRVVRGWLRKLRRRMLIPQLINSPLPEKGAADTAIALCASARRADELARCANGRHDCLPYLDRVGTAILPCNRPGGPTGDDILCQMVYSGFYMGLMDSVKGLFKEQTDGILSAVEVRLKNPIYGTFVISWLLFNWKAVAVMVFEKDCTIRERFCILSNMGYSGWELWWPMVGLPIIATLAVLLLMPLASLLPTWWTCKIQNWHNRILADVLKTIHSDINSCALDFKKANKTADFMTCNAHLLFTLCIE